jgi:hypothetical protein
MLGQFFIIKCPRCSSEACVRRGRTGVCGRGHHVRVNR